APAGACSVRHELEHPSERRIAMNWFAFAKTARFLPNPAGTGKKVEALLRQLGWHAMPRDNWLWVPLNDQAGQPRCVGIREGQRFITLWLFSTAHPQPAQVPVAIWPYLLMRNELAAAATWHISPSQTVPGSLYFVLCYRALPDGLDADILKYL